jgi:putative ABC transport system permease protein
MRTLLFDLHDAIRSLRRDRAYTTIVAATLALTIGATTTIFSIVDGVLLKPLAFAEADRLVTVHEVWHEFRDRAPTLPVNERHFEYWRANTTTFAALAQYLPLPANLTSGGEAAQVSVARTSSSLFDVLGVPVAAGRTLLPSDEPDGRPDVGVISDALWRTRFGGDASAIGAAIVLDGRPYTVVGVLPSTFRLPMGEQLVGSVDVFVPLRVNVGWAGDHNNVAIGRLRPGVSLDQARAELDVMQQQVGAIASKESGERVTLSGVVTPLDESIVGRSRRGLLLLLGAVASVLLIACANLANLSLSRTIGRARDGAIRAALGASRGRLIRRTVIEQLTLGVFGALAGLWVASTGLSLFVRTAPVDLPRLEEVAIDGRIVVFAFAVATIAAFIVSVVPAWRLGSGDVQATLRAGGAGVGADRSGMRARAALTALQVALSVTLLAVTGLLGASLLRVLQVDHGFSAERVVAVPLALPAARYADDRTRIPVYDRILADVRTIPGVTSVSSTSLLPMRGEGQVNFIVAEDRPVPRPQQPSANFRFVAPQYFETLELPLPRGRSFTDAERDPSRPTPAVVSESVAARLWPGEDPIGRRFSRGVESEPPFEVVGVTIDARTTSIERTPPLMVYVPYWWRSRSATSLLVKTAADGASVVPDVRRVVRAIDAEIAVGQARVLQDVVAGATAGRRYQAQLFVVFATVALLIATLGVYAATAYSLSKRRREMNIRVALGARRSEVLGLIVRQTGASIAAGVALGVAGALALGNAVAGLLYGVQPRDPWILALVAVIVGSVGLVSTGVAAKKGLVINPVAALRED